MFMADAGDPTRLNEPDPLANTFRLSPPFAWAACANVPHAVLGPGGEEQYLCWIVLLLKFM